MDVIIAGVHRSPWVQGPGESWMELIPAVEFPNFEINIAMNTQSGHFQQGGAKMCMRLSAFSKYQNLCIHYSIAVVKIKMLYPAVMNL